LFNFAWHVVILRVAVGSNGGENADADDMNTAIQTVAIISKNILAARFDHARDNSRMKL
jgi:hypothetical protein